MANPLQAALEYARLGYAVLPLLPGEKRPHSRLAPNGLTNATPDPEVLRRWWQAVPTAGVGILPPEQVLVLDFDAPEVWEQLRAEYPELATAPRQRSPRGGVHVFLKLPKSLIGSLTTTARKMPGLDLRGLGKAYLAAAPTELPNGGYSWEVPLLPPAELPLPPEGLLKRLLPEPPPPPPEYQPASFRGVKGDKLTRRLEGLLRWGCERVATTPEGQRHNTLLSYARLIGGYVHLGLDPEQVTSALAEAAMQAGLPHSEAEATARDGLRYGLDAPLELPPDERGRVSAGQKPPPADPRESHQQVVGLLEGLTPETWPEQRAAFFEGLQSLDPVSVDLLLKKAASRLGVGAGTLQKAFKEHAKRGEEAEPTAAGEAVRLALASGLSLWHTPEREPWGSFEVEGIVHHYPVRGRDFRTWLGGIYYGQKGKPLYAQALQDALAALEAQATYQGTQHPVFVRLAWHEGRIYFDLSRPDRQVVEIAPTGWRVIASADCPVRFRRTPHQLPLPLPEPGGSLEPLLQLLPLREARDRVVLLGWLVGVLNPWGGYPILLLQGSKGAGKSFVARVLKTLVDAGKAPLRSEPDNKLDLLVTAAGNHVLALDNLSAVSTKLSDLLCTLSTGGGAGKRTLYTDGDEFVLEAARPLILTGIALGPLRDDLADRVLTLNLERLEATARRPERELFGRFEQVRGDALGALFSAAAVALARWEEVSNSLSQLPRLGDWATWAEAAAPALGLQEGEIVEATFEVQGSLQRDLLDADPVARAVVALTTAFAAGERRKFTTSELLEALEKAAGVEAPRKPEGWPKTSVGLAKHLPRLQDALREVGVLLQGRRDSHTKTLTWFLEKWGGPSTATTANTANSVQNDKKPAVDVAVDAVDATTTPHQPPQRKTEYWTAFAVDAVDAVDAPPHLSKEQEQEEEGGDWEVVL